MGYMGDYDGQMTGCDGFDDGMGGGKTQYVIGYDILGFTRWDGLCKHLWVTQRCPRRNYSETYDGLYKTNLRLIE